MCLKQPQTCHLVLDLVRPKEAAIDLEYDLLLLVGCRVGWCASGRVPQCQKVYAIVVRLARGKLCHVDELGIGKAAARDVFNLLAEHTHTGSGMVRRRRRPGVVKALHFGEEVTPFDYRERGLPW